MLLLFYRDVTAEFLPLQSGQSDFQSPWPSLDLWTVVVQSEM